MRKGQQEVNKIVIEKFQELLRSGNDYSVDYMYKESGALVYVSGRMAAETIRNHYKSIITREMIDFALLLDCSTIKKVELFSERFSLCFRESRLILRYINWIR